MILLPFILKYLPVLWCNTSPSLNKEINLTINKIKTVHLIHLMDLGQKLMPLFSSIPCNFKSPQVCANVFAKWFFNEFGFAFYWHGFGRWSQERNSDFKSILHNVVMIWMWSQSYKQNHKKFSSGNHLLWDFFSWIRLSDS